MATVNLPFGAGADMRAPTSGELSTGYPCGAADIELFNWLANWTTGQIAAVIEAAGLTVDDAISDPTKLTLLADAIRWFTPAGAVQSFAMSTPPSGWLECDGSTLSRTTYADLFSALGETFGAGDGSTTFAIPDLRGEFLRGWDNGRGVDASRVFGSAQGDAIRDIVGTLNMGGMFVGSASGAFTIDATTDGTDTAVGSGANDDVSFAASNVVPTADENRPRNVALMFCIRY